MHETRAPTNMHKRALSEVAMVTHWHCDSMQQINMQSCTVGSHPGSCLQSDNENATDYFVTKPMHVHSGEPSRVQLGNKKKR